MINDICPLEDGITEAAACVRIGGSKDIQTDVYTTRREDVVGDAQPRPHPESGRTSAASPASRQHIINNHRYQKISAANRQVARDVSSGPSSNRAFRVTFDTVVLAIEPTSSSTPGRLHAENILFPLAPGHVSFEHRRVVATPMHFVRAC